MYQKLNNKKLHFVLMSNLHILCATHNKLITSANSS